MLSYSEVLSVNISQHCDSFPHIQWYELLNFNISRTETFLNAFFVTSLSWNVMPMLRILHGIDKCCFTKLSGYMSRALWTVQLRKKGVDFMCLGKWTAAKLPPVIPIVSMFSWYSWQYTNKQNFGGLKGTFQMLPLPNIENRNWSPK